MAYVGLTTIACLAGLVSWGLALIVPAILSRIIADNCRRRGVRIHFPLLVACAYCGHVVWVQGLSSSIPLVLNTPAHFLEQEVGLIGLDQTIFSWWSLSILAAIVIILPQVLSRLVPDREHIVELPAEAESGTGPQEREVAGPGATPSEKLENARWVTLMLALFGGVYVVRYFLGGGQLQVTASFAGLQEAGQEPGALVFLEDASAIHQRAQQLKLASLVNS